MPKVLIESYSTYYDRVTRVKFEPVLDRRTGCHVGVAEVTEEQAESYAERGAFRVLDADEWAAMNRQPEVWREPAPQTGDPLRDAALGKAPPPPPDSK